MAKFRCGYCKFKFTYLTAPKNCPYCGKAGAVAPEESAEDIMQDINKFLENS